MLKSDKFDAETIEPSCITAFLLALNYSTLSCEKIFLFDKQHFVKLVERIVVPKLDSFNCKNNFSLNPQFGKVLVSVLLINTLVHLQ